MTVATGGFLAFGLRLRTRGFFARAGTTADSFASAVRRPADERLDGEEVDARRREGEECAAFARGFALSVDMGLEIGFEDAEDEAVEGVAMVGAEKIAALRGARTRRPGGASCGMNEAGAERHAITDGDKRNRKRDPSTAGRSGRPSAQVRFSDSGGVHRTPETGDDGCRVDGRRLAKHVRRAQHAVPLQT